jgi:hypothetical protein
MKTWTPAEWGLFFTSAGGFVIVLSGQIIGIIVSLRNGRKVDANTMITSDIHKVTNGPLIDMGKNVIGIATQAATNAAVAAATAEAAKVQAATDATASKESK